MPNILALPLLDFHNKIYKFLLYSYKENQLTLRGGGNFDPRALIRTIW
jgi:hypothetical protein